MCSRCRCGGEADGGAAPGLRAAAVLWWCRRRKAASRPQPCSRSPMALCRLSRSRSQSGSSEVPARPPPGDGVRGPELIAPETPGSVSGSVTDRPGPAQHSRQTLRNRNNRELSQHWHHTSAPVCLDIW